MKTLRLILTLALFLAPLVARAQNNPNPAPPAPSEAPPEVIIAQKSQSEVSPPPPPATAVIRTGGRIGGGPGPVRFGPLGGSEFGPGGAWWKNSEIVRKLNLTDEQVKRISQTFLDHKLKLIDLQADLDKQELRLQPLMDIDQPDESKVGAQIDLITAARGKLEKENAMMMLDIRRWLSVDQWKKLKSLDLADEGKKKPFFFQTLPGGNGEGPLPPPLPGDMPVIRH
ncbi:MAG: periplasmic heavy metal sensor [Terriglobia bacterium]